MICSSAFLVFESVVQKFWLILFPKIVLFQKFCVKNFCVKKFWVKNFLGQNFFGSTKFESKKLRVKIIFVSKDFFKSKTFWVKKSFGSKKFLGQNFFLSQKNFRVKFFFVKTDLWNPTQFWGYVELWLVWGFDKNSHYKTKKTKHTIRDLFSSQNQSRAYHFNPPPTTQWALRLRSSMWHLSSKFNSWLSYYL